MKSSVLLILLFTIQVAGYSQSIIKLYPGAAPGSEDWTWSEQKFGDSPEHGILYNVTEPELIHYPAPKDKAHGTAVIIAPGGAFHILAIDNEGRKIAEWLNGLGISAFVLKYRLVRSKTNNPLQELGPLMQDKDKLDSINAPVVEMAKNDGIRAMEYVRENARQLQIAHDKIGFMGFSAGGTVTMSVALSASEELKPDFLVPVYLYRNAVLGTLMPEKTTPIFVAVASDDELDFMPHSVSLYQDWYAAGHPSELHVYENGGHGFGFAKKGTSSDQWTKDFENWLKVRNLIP